MNILRYKNEVAWILSITHIACGHPMNDIEAEYMKRYWQQREQEPD